MDHPKYSFRIVSILAVLVSAVIGAEAFADVLCINGKTRAITAEASCPAGTTALNGSNFASAVGVAPASSCTVATGTNRGTNFNGEVGVAVSCSRGVMLSRSFSTTDTTSSNPVLKSESVIKNKAGVPIGTQIVMKGKQNGFYSVTLRVDCCV
jgi:hypothetical protein